MRYQGIAQIARTAIGLALPIVLALGVYVLPAGWLRLMLTVVLAISVLVLTASSSRRSWQIRSLVEDRDDWVRLAYNGTSNAEEAVDLARAAIQQARSYEQLADRSGQFIERSTDALRQINETLEASMAGTSSHQHTGLSLPAFLNLETAQLQGLRQELVEAHERQTVLEAKEARLRSKISAKYTHPDPKDRRAIADEYLRDKAAGKATSQAAWSKKYFITDRTLRNYLAEFYKEE